MRVGLKRRLVVLAGQGKREGEGRVVEGEGRGARHRTRHVGDAVMHHAIQGEGRLGMGGRLARLEATALVDRDIHQHRSPAHLGHHFLRHELGRGGARHQHSAHHQVGMKDMGLDRIDRGVDRVQFGAEQRVQLVEAAQRLVDDGDARLHTDGHAHRVGARDAAADHQHIRRRHARHAAQQHATAALRLFQAMGAGLDRHAPGHLAHGRQKRQAAQRIGDRLVGDGDAARFDQGLGQRGLGRQMQIGEQDLAVAQQLVFLRLRLLHLHDHVGLGEYFRRVGNDLGSSGLVVGVGDADALARLALDHHLVAVMRQFAHAAGHHSHAVFVILDFLGNADAHDPPRLTNRMVKDAPPEGARSTWGGRGVLPPQ